MIELTSEQQEEIKAEILKRMEERWNMGTLISEPDFIAGAVTVVQMLVGGDGLWKPAAPWFFLVMGNRSVLASVVEQRGEEKQAARIQAKMDKDFMRRAHANEMVEFLNVVVNNTKPYQSYDYDTNAFMREQALALLEDIDEYPEELS